MTAPNARATQTTNVALTLEQINELLMATRAVDWENETFIGAISALTEAGNSLKATLEGVTLSPSRDCFSRTDDNGGFNLPAMLPHAGYFALTYGHLIPRGEVVCVDRLADRIEAYYDNPRTKIEAGELRRWLALMNYAEDHAKRFGALPVEFEWEDGLYTGDDIPKILGPRAVAHLLSADNPI